MSTYSTIQGDTWDGIAHKALGSVSHTAALMAANMAYIHLFIFPAGVKLELPAVSNTTIDALPPWKRVST